MYLIEVDRILRPGGYWILSGPPINWESHWKGWNRTTGDLQDEQSKIEVVAKSLCWKKLKQKGDIAIWQKPTNHIHCKRNRKALNVPDFCKGGQDPDTAWFVNTVCFDSFSRGIQKDAQALALFLSAGTLRWSLV